MCIIGGGFGDCGKGLMTDYFASKMEDSVVIRSNGGAQAGHTVVTPEGQRHVFSHLSSGSFNGRSTYLSEYFVANPLLLDKELKVFNEVSNGMKVNIFAHPDMLITTPFDMLLNQRVEKSRGDELHGSVGVGFGETLERAKTHSRLTFRMVYSWMRIGKQMDSFAFVDNLFTHMDAIRKEYVPTKVNLNKVSPSFLEVLNNDELIYETINQIREMLEVIDLVDYTILRNRPLIFEGAQGLLLDQDYGYFPHVTRSNCGMRNISAILNQIPGKHDVTVNYVTRAYATRHGAGPLYDEDPLLFDKYNIVDETNVKNDWQGELRFAPLNYDLFESITNKDFALYAPVGAKRVSTITCLDQLEGSVHVYTNSQAQNIDPNVFREQIVPQLFEYQSYGPTRNDVVPTDNVDI
jgi:adenylosuccinate synthase